LSQVCKALKMEVLGTPLEVRQMLAGACESLGSEVFERSASGKRARTVPVHPYEACLLGMVDETLMQMRAALDVEATNARSSASKLRADDRPKVLESAQTAKRAELRDKEASVSAQIAEVSLRRHAASQAKASEKLAAAEVRKLEKQVAACAKERCDAEASFKAFETLESGGAAPLSAAEARQLLKNVEAQMRVMKVGATLVPSAHRAVLPALKMHPAKRTRFDEAALTTAEGCFRDYVQEKAGALKGLHDEVAAAQEAATQALLKSESLCQEADDLEDVARRMGEEAGLCAGELRALESAQKSHASALAAREGEAVACNKSLVELDCLLAWFGRIIGKAQPAGPPGGKRKEEIETTSNTDT